MMYIHIHIHSPFSEYSCPVDGGRVFLEDTTPIRIVMSQPGKLLIILTNIAVMQAVL